MYFISIYTQGYPLVHIAVFNSFLVLSLNIFLPEEISLVIRLITFIKVAKIKFFPQIHGEFWIIAYREENRLQFLCLYDPSHRIHCVYYSCPLITFIFKGKVINFHGLAIKTKRILGLQLVQMQVKIIVPYAYNGALNRSLDR